MRLDQTPRFVTSGWVEVPEAAVLRGGSWRTRRLPVRYGLLDHPVAGLTLIDTGYTPHTVTDPSRSLSMKINSALLRAKLSPEGQPEAVLARFGRGLSDVACVILTHFHADHVSGLRLFENARFIGARADLEVMGRRARWRNAAQGMFDALLPTDFHERFEPIEACAQVDRARLSGLRDLFGDGSLCAVPLPGHTQGHFGLLYHTAGGPVLYGCDAQYVHAALAPGHRPGAPSKWFVADPAAREHSTDILWSFAQDGGRVVLCHDDGGYEDDFDLTHRDLIPHHVTCRLKHS